MAEPCFPEKAFLIIGIMYKSKRQYEMALEALQKRFGKISTTSDEFEFDFTKYYDSEMDRNLKKIFVAFEEKIDISALPDIKLYTNSIEEGLTKNRIRSVNLDPGYLTKNQLIVASAKSRPHRIYLGKGIYAHIMYFFRKDGVVTFRWTFPDYRKKENIEFFLGLRKKF
ncbi:MAG: DUF4416 family protein [Nanoarchaeota archaeon]|nr:DUF4416 family protein [Nanoarchaeota archaeon]